MSSKHQSEFQALWQAISSRLGWSRSALAGKIGVTPSAISLMVRGEINPSGQTVQSIRTLLRLEAPEVVEVAEELLRNRPQGKPLAEPFQGGFPTELERYQKGYQLTPERVEQLRELGPDYAVDYGAKLRQLPVEQQRAVRHLIDVLVSSDLAARAGQLALAAAADVRHDAGLPLPGIPEVSPAGGSRPGSNRPPTAKPMAEEVEAGDSSPQQPATAGGTSTVGRVKPGKSRRKRSHE